MKKFALLLITLVAIFYISVYQPFNTSATLPSEQITSKNWAETIATITAQRLEDGSFGFTITYDAPESTAVNSEGQKIHGPISQHGISQKEPLDQQKLRLKYMRDEPIIFELIDSMKYKV